jgi:transposase-like protein
MTSVSLTQACIRLGIDAKTLHRWLAQAQLPLQGHPTDGRKKGVSQEQLQVLARLHHRHLAPPAEEVPPPQAGGPSEVLAISEHLTALQAQLTALRTSVADLTHLLEQSALPVAQTQPSRTVRRAPRPAPPVPRSPRAASAAATAPRKPTHVIPRVEYVSEGRYVVICPKKGVLPFEPESEEWFAWVAEQESFRFVGKLGHFSAHHEWRIPKGAWRAYRKIRNRNYILRLAPNHELTIAVLEQVAAALQAHLQ